MTNKINILQKIFWVILLAGVLFYSCSKANESELQGNNVASCDTTNMTYQLNVLPILMSNCYSCHGTDSYQAISGIDLDGYANLKVQVFNGNLISAITHTGGVTPMPYNLPKLSDCEINTIKDWVNRGALNN